MGEKWSDYIQGEKQLDGNDWLGEHKKWRPATGTARLWHVKWGTGRFPFKHHQQQQMVWRQEGNNAVSQQKIYWLALEVEKCSWGDVGTGLLPQAPCWGRKSPLRQGQLIRATVYGGACAHPACLPRPPRNTSFPWSCRTAFSLVPLPGSLSALTTLTLGSPLTITLV